MIITSVPELVRELGGARRVARALGSTPREIEFWIAFGWIRPGWHYRLHLMAEARGHSIAREVFELEHFDPLATA